MLKSPYGADPARWSRITKKLVASHPLTTDLVRDTALNVWSELWKTKVGSGSLAVDLSTLIVPATIVGYFFEVLFARELARRFPELWRGGQGGDEKDLVYIPDAGFSVEIKTSGQRGFKIYGNRSYGQELQNIQAAKKDKSGYYITVNFYQAALTLLRFGWIDAADWTPQRSPTGQMAGLPAHVYTHKLVPISGDYRLNVPVQLLPGVGPKRESEFHQLGIYTLGDLRSHAAGLPASLQKLYAAIEQVELGGPP